MAGSRGSAQPPQQMAPVAQRSPVTAPSGGGKGGARTQPFNVNTAASQTLQQSIGATQRELGYQPMAIQAQNYRPATMGAQGYNAAQAGATGYGAERVAGVGPIMAQNVQAGQLAGTSLTPYTNPYESQVVQQSLQDIERARQIQQNQLGAQATAAGAFGGSRQGIAEAETNRAFAEQAARTASGLRQAGFTQAQQAAQQDIGTRMQAALANQQAGLQAGTTTAQMGLQAQQLNQAAQNQAAQFGAAAANQAAMQNAAAMNAARQFGATAGNTASAQNQAAINAARQAFANQSFQAQQANQAAQLAGSQQRMGAASQLAGLGQQGFNYGQSIANQQLQQGNMAQLLNQTLLDKASQQYAGYTQSPNAALNTLLTAVGAGNMGQQTQTTTRQPGLFDYLTLGLGGYQAYQYGNRG